MYKFLVIVSTVAIMSCSSNNDDNDVNVLQSIESLSKYETEISQGVSLIFFHATWCSICKAQRPEVEALTQDNALQKVKLRQVDTDEHKDITAKYNVPGQPIIIIYKNGKEEKRFAGSGHSQAKLTEILKGLL